MPFVCRRDENSTDHAIVVSQPWEPTQTTLRKITYEGKSGLEYVNLRHSNRLLHDVLAKHCREFLSRQYAIASTVHNVYRPAVRMDIEFITDLLAYDSEISERWKYDGQQVYTCDVSNNTWQSIGSKNHTMRMLQRRILETIPTLNSKERSYLNGKQNLLLLYEAFVLQIEDLSFKKSLDKNLDYFVTVDKVLPRNAKIMRSIVPADRLSLTSRWRYDEDLATKHHRDVHEFFRKLFPYPDERRIVSVFLASLLHGHRIDKHLLMFTDKRDGNNGKSTLINLLSVFFGCDFYYGKSNFVCKSSLQKDKDSHDAVMESMRYKRLLVADELNPSSRLDVDLLKNVVSSRTKVHGRSFGSKTTFQFQWQAGIILGFNQDDFPAVESMNQAFDKRLVLCPFRSKFLPCLEGGDDDSSFTYVCDPTIDEQFPAWCSALLHYLMEYRRPNGSQFPSR